MRGGERVLEALMDLFPTADVYTLFHDKRKIDSKIASRIVQSSFLQKIPGIKKIYRFLLPLLPATIEAFKLRNYDLVLSTSHCVAKGVIPPPGAVHICYIFSPARYVWTHFDQYFGRVPKPLRFLAHLMAHYIRLWDVQTASRVDHFIANSHNVAGRVRRFYGREASVAHSPIDWDKFMIGSPENFYLYVGALVPYKRADLAIAACNELQRTLKIIGDGSELKRLQKKAGPTIEFLGWRSPEERNRYYSSCRAVLFPGEEDFGLVPVEAMASGRPVIALSRGGALETVTSETGIFFGTPHKDSLIQAIERFEAREELFAPQQIREHTRQFDRGVFLKKITEIIAQYVK